MRKLNVVAALTATTLFASPAFAADGLNTSVYHGCSTANCSANPATDYTFVNANINTNAPNAISWHTGYGSEVPTIANFFGADAAGAALTDYNTASSFRVDSQGFIDVANAATYTFNLSADDWANLLIDGNSVATAPDWHTAGSDTLSLSAGYHSFDLNYLGDGLPNGLWFSYSGGPLSFSTTNGASLTGAVPEPATWAMMLLGFGAIGLTMRRKRQTLVTA